MKYLFPILFIFSFAFFLFFRSNSIAPQDIISLTNRERVIPLRESDCLSSKASERAKELVVNDYFGHVSPLTGKNPAWEMIESCVDYSYAGENLIKDFKKAKNAHFALMNSKTHRDNIVNVEFHQMGVGCYEEVCVELFSD
jgi:uncharacterized protein YkwD